MTCLACGPTSATPSREHIFSQWLQEFLNIRNLSLGLYRRNNEGSAERTRPDISLSSFTLKRICGTCNNGWMSRLEERVKPVLKPLLDGSSTLESLDVDQRQVLAQWAAKTAIIESHSIGAQSPVPGALLQWMRAHEGDPRGRFTVAASSLNLGMVGHMQIGQILGTLGGSMMAGNIILLAFPNIVLACGFPVPQLNLFGYLCRCDLSVYRPLWPGASEWAGMKGLLPFTGQETDDAALLDMASRIEIFHPMIEREAPRVYRP
jgi:hypothetical protein